MRQITGVERQGVSRLTAVKHQRTEYLHFLVLQVVAIGLGYALFSLIDLNNPDGITMSPSPISLFLFIFATVIGTLLVIIALDSSSVLERSDWNALGWGLVILMMLVVIWYRGVWLVSPYVTDALSDHFTYLRQSFIIAEQQGGTLIPSPAKIVINSYSHLFLIAILFNALGRSGFFVIALQVMFVAWSSLCLAQLFATRYSKADDHPYRGRTSTVALSFLIMPLSVFTSGIIAKDTFVLLGISLTLVAFHALKAKTFSWISLIVLLSGLFIVIISRIGHAIALVAGILLLLFLFRQNFRDYLKQLMLVGFLLLIGIALIQWTAETGLLALYDRSATSVLEDLSLTVESGTLAYHSEGSSLLYRVARPFGEGLAANFLSLPLAGATTWFIPFPFFIPDYRSVLHTSNALANIVSLTFFIAALPILKDVFVKILQNKSKFLDALMLSFALLMFAAIAWSSTPIPRYRLPFDWAILYFVFSQPNPGRLIGRGLFLSLLAVVLVHLIYYAVA